MGNITSNQIIYSLTLIILITIYLINKNFLTNSTKKGSMLI